MSGKTITKNEKKQIPAKEHVFAVFLFSVSEKIMNTPLRIQGLAMTTGMSRNFNIYTPEELQSFAGKLVDAPVYLEHVNAQDAWARLLRPSGMDKTFSM